MRNLKRVLSLALALVMVLGMMVITTSAAAYTDADEITYEEAIAVMSGVGLYEGYDDGSLKPTEILTREQAATLITRIMLGDIAKTLEPTQQIFTDVATTRWSAAAIEYCYNIGMIDGLGDGTFDPAGELTGTAFAKLLLVALGYDAAAEGYTGSDWKKNINADALAENLYVEDVNIAAPCTREVAAQMVLQVLTQKTVRYVTSYDYSTQANVVTGPWDNANTFAEKYYPTLVKDTTAGAYDDMWGRPADYAWIYGKTPSVLWTEWEEAVAAYTVAVSDCQIATDMGLKKDTTIGQYTNGVKATTYIDVDAVAANNGAQGAQLEVYSDRVVRIDTYLAKVDGVVTEIKDAAGHLVRSAKNEFDVYGLVDADAAVAGNKYAKNDMILVNYNEVKDVYVDLGLATSFVGAQSFIWWNLDKHTVNGTEYMDACKFDKVSADAAGITLKTNYVWYMDQFGNIIGNFAIFTPKNYAVVEGVQWVNTWGVNGYAQANVRYMDGTTNTVIVKDVTPVGGEKANTMVYADYSKVMTDANDFNLGNISTVWQYNDDCMDDLYEIVENIDGTVSLIEQAEVASATVADGVSLIGGSTVYTDNYTVYMLRTQNAITGAYSYSVVTGYDNLEATWTGVEIDYVLNPITSGGFAKYVYITANSDLAAAKNASDYIYFTSNTRYYGDALQNNVPCYVIGGVVRADGNTDVLYVAKTDALTPAALYELLSAAQDKLFVVSTTNGIVADWSTDVVAANDTTELSKLGKKVSYVDYAAKGTFGTIDGNGVLKVVANGTTTAYNVNAATTIINKGGVGTVTDLNTAALTGKAIYVIGAYDVKGAAKTTQVLAIFITEPEAEPVVTPTVDNAWVEFDGETVPGAAIVNYVGTMPTTVEAVVLVEAAIVNAGYEVTDKAYADGVYTWYVTEVATGFAMGTVTYGTAPVENVVLDDVKVSVDDVTYTISTGSKGTGDVKVAGDSVVKTTKLYIKVSAGSTPVQVVINGKAYSWYKISANCWSSFDFYPGQSIEIVAQ